jgi:DNA-binding NarL/FixJ family response regulator
MTLTLKPKSKKLTAVESTRPRLIQNDVDCGADSRSESAAGGIGASRKPPNITVAEQRVLSLVSRAWTNKEIASALGISPATVKRHVEKILTKLGFRNRVEVAIFGITVNGCPHQSSAGCALRQPKTAR